MSQFSISPITQVNHNFQFQGRYSYVSPPQPQNFGQLRPYDAQNSFFNNRTNSSHCSQNQGSASPRGKINIKLALNPPSPTYSSRFDQPQPFHALTHQLEVSPSPIRTTHKSKNNIHVSASVNNMNQPVRDVSPRNFNKQPMQQNLPPKNPSIDPRLLTHSPNNRLQQTKPQQQPYLNINQNLLSSTPTPTQNHQFSVDQQRFAGFQQQNIYNQQKGNLGHANILMNDVQSDHSLVSSREKTVPTNSNPQNMQQHSTSIFSLDDKTQPSTRKQLLSQMNNLKEIMSLHQEKENRAQDNTTLKSSQPKTSQQLSSTIILLHSEIDRHKIINQEQAQQQHSQVETLKLIIQELQEKSEQLLRENENLNCALRDEEQLILELQQRVQENEQSDKGNISESFIFEHEKLIDKYGCKIQYFKLKELQQEYQNNEKQLKQLMKDHRNSKQIDLPLQSVNQYRESGKLVEAIHDLNQEIELWKQKYLEADRKNEEMPMLEISLKNCSSTIIDLENRIKCILHENEKLKIQATEKLQLQQKVQNMLKEQNKSIQDSEELELLNKQQRLVVTQMENKISDLEMQILQNKNLKESMQEVEIKIKQQINYNEQLRNQQISSQKHHNHKIKELEYAVDCFQREQDNLLITMKDQQNENDQLKQKLIKCNDVEQKLKNTQQEASKLFTQLQEKLFCLEEETERRLQMEDYCNQLKQQFIELESQKNHVDEDLAHTKQESNRLNNVCEIIKNQYQQLQQDQEQSKQKAIYMNDQYDEMKQLLYLSQEATRQDQKNQQILQDQIQQQKQQLSNFQNDKQHMHSLLDQQNVTHQVQLQDLKRQLDLWFRSQIEVEIRGALSPIMEEKNKLNELITFLQQKNEVQDMRLKKVIEDQESLQREKREVEFLNETLRQKQVSWEERENELNDRDKKITQKYQEKERDFGLLMQKYRQLNQELQEMKEWNLKYQNSFIDSKEAKFNAERVAFETHITQLKEKLIQYENTNLRLAEENDRLGITLSEKNTEIEILSSDLIQVTQQSQEQVEMMKKEMDKYKNNQDDSDTDKLRMESQRQQSDSQIKQLTDSLRNYKEEQEKLYILMSKRKDEQETSTRLLEEKKKELQKFSKVNLELQTVLRQAHDKIDQLQREVDDLCRNREDYRQQVFSQFQFQSERYSMEVTKKNKELVQKIEELNVLKCKYEDAIYHLQDLESTLIVKLQNNQ